METAIVDGRSFQTREKTALCKRISRGRSMGKTAYDRSRVIGRENGIIHDALMSCARRLTRIKRGVSLSPRCNARVRKKREKRRWRRKIDTVTSFFFFYPQRYIQVRSNNRVYSLVHLAHARNVVFVVSLCAVLSLINSSLIFPSPFRGAAYFLLWKPFLLRRDSDEVVVTVYNAWTVKWNRRLEDSQIDAFWEKKRK